MSDSPNLQKIIIPKGLVNPEQITIVEIPTSLKNVATVVAQPKGQEDFEMACPARKQHGKTLPRMSKKNMDWYHDNRHTFGGVPNDSSTMDSLVCPSSTGSGSCPASRGSSEQYSSRSHSRNVSGNYSQSGSTSRTQSSCEGPSPPGRMKITRPKPNFFTDFSLPDKHLHDSQYATFRPKLVSSPDPDAKVSFIEARNRNDPRANFSLSEPSDSDRSAMDDFIPMANSSRVRRAPYNDQDLFGGLSSEMSDVVNSLNSVEEEEMSLILSDIKNFQSARKKLIFDAVSLKSASDISRDLLSSSDPSGGYEGNASFNPSDDNGDELSGFSNYDCECAPRARLN